jgi:hypothetical protein
MGIDQVRSAERGKMGMHAGTMWGEHAEDKIPVKAYSPSVPSFCPLSLFSFLLFHVPRSRSCLSDLGFDRSKQKAPLQQRAVLLIVTLVLP